jgi:hypothetical protein
LAIFFYFFFSPHGCNFFVVQLVKHGASSRRL